MSKRTALAAVILAVVAGTAVSLAGAAAAGTSTGFVTRQGSQLRLDGKQFRFYGSNNYYLMYKSRLMVDDVFADAKAAGFTVLRTWGFLDIGNADGSNSIRGKSDGVYFQYWNGTAPAYNDGPDGLQRLDYVLFAARQAADAQVERGGRGDVGVRGRGGAVPGRVPARRVGHQLRRRAHQRRPQAALGRRGAARIPPAFRGLRGRG